MNTPDEILASAHESTIEFCVRAEQRLHDRVMQRVFGIVSSGEHEAIGRYEVIERVGEGIGAVELARDPEHDRDVAIKILHLDAGSSCRTRLADEAETMTGLAHPNIVSVLDQGEHQGNLFVAMERVDGRTLQQWQRRAPRSRHRIIEVYCQAARGLHAAHQTGVMHRDFKPNNVVVLDDGDSVKVTDFGLAQARETLEQRIAESIGPDCEDIDSDDQVQGALRSLAGTPAYMAPEIIRGTTPDARSDQFSFCVSLYESLCAERPFVASTLRLLLVHIMTGTRRPRPPVALPPRLWAVIERGLSIDPAERFDSMQQLEQALARCMAPA